MDGGKPDKVNPRIAPIEFKVLVLPDPEPDVTKGGIIKPLAYRDQKQMAAIAGRIIAISDEAFDWMEDGSRRPQVGERVAFTKYAGLLQQGADGKTYRLMNDKDIAGILEFEPDDICDNKNQ